MRTGGRVGQIESMHAHLACLCAHRAHAVCVCAAPARCWTAVASPAVRLCLWVGLAARATCNVRVAHAARWACNARVTYAARFCLGSTHK
eukprot:351897-Chlamydomonas_euryale.AAC.6